MTKNNKKIQQPQRGMFRIFEIITELMGWWQIVLSPFLIGLIIGAVVYFYEPTTIRLIIGVIIATTGLVIGIIWATKQWKGKGATSFIANIMSTPEIDNSDEGNKNLKINRTKKNQV